MRKKKQNGTEPIARRFPALEEQEVALGYFAPEAKSVQVAGSFNLWRPEANPLQRSETGEWTVRLQLRAGRYEYLFIVDGEWMTDPRAARSAPNSYGTLNSVLEVPLQDREEFL